MRRSRILIVDDEPGMLEVYSDTLDYLGDDVELHTEGDSLRAAERLAEEGFDLLLTDLRMPGLTGVELLEKGRQHDPELPALIITAYPSVDSAVETMKLGAVDYITKPFHPEELLHTTRQLLEGRRLLDDNRILQRQLKRSFPHSTIIGQSPAIERIRTLIEHVAASDVDVLILGETGTGKELVAREIHQRSQRRDKHFVPVDCGAIPENLLESEFFGHEKGAFTGASSRSIGLMEFASGGTFFLDELGELPLFLQAKLLRVLQERKIRRIGGKEERPVDIRVIAATRRDIDEAVQEKRFREDLFYRINVLRIELPPLRARKEDIPELSRHFLERHKSEVEKEVRSLHPETVELLQSYDWPGNIRELQNAIRHAIAITPHPEISPYSLPAALAQVVTPRASFVSVDQSQPYHAQKEAVVARFEREYITALLEAHSGEVTAATRAAGLPRGTFYRLMKKHALEAKDFRLKKNDGA